MENNGRPVGFILRDAFETALKGHETRCGVCGESGVIGKDLSAVYNETDMPWGRNYSVWAICDQCRKAKTNED